MEALNAELARKTIKNYACSNCWGDLVLRPDLRENGMYFAVCEKCQDETKGYVTKYFVRTRRAASEFEARDVKRTLQRAGILPKKQMTEAEMMQELGF